MYLWEMDGTKEVSLHQPLGDVASIPNILGDKKVETPRFFMVILLGTNNSNLDKNSLSPCLPKRTLIIPVSEWNSIIVVSTRLFVMIGKIEGERLRFHSFPLIKKHWEKVCLKIDTLEIWEKFYLIFNSIEYFN